MIRLLEFTCRAWISAIFFMLFLVPTKNFVLCLVSFILMFIWIILPIFREEITNFGGIEDERTN